MDEIGKEVFDSRLIAMQYLSGSFLIDLVAALPVELFTDQQQEANTDMTTKFPGLLKLGRLLRINRIIRYLNTNKDFKAGAQLLNIILFLIIYLHFYSCLLWILVHEEK